MIEAIVSTIDPVFPIISRSPQQYRQLTPPNHLYVKKLYSLEKFIKFRIQSSSCFKIAL